MNELLISLVMPLREAASHLPEMLESLRQQTDPHWELLMVLDQADAETTRLAHQAAQLDGRMRVLTNRGRGIIQALETGRWAARGWALGRLDGDDMLPPKRLATMRSALQKAPAHTVVTGWVRYFTQEGAVSPGYRRYEAWLNANLAGAQPWRQVYRECLVASPNWLIRRATLEKTGGFQGLQYPEDYDLLLRWYQWGLKLETVPEVTLLWREHPARTSRNSPRYQQGSFFRLKVSRFTQFDYDPNRKLYLLGAGQKGKWAARVLRARGITFEWLARYPYQGKKNRQVQGQSLQSMATLQGGGQVLVAVYPPAGQRAILTAFLSRRSYREGSDYWFL